MELKFKRSLVGYDPLSVQKTFGELEADFQKKIQEINRKIEVENHDFGVLKEEVRSLQEEIKSLKALENEVIRLLHASHLQATEEVLAASREAAAAEKDSEAKVVVKQNELAELKASVEKIWEEFRSVASRYKQA